MDETVDSILDDDVICVEPTRAKVRRWLIVCSTSKSDLEMQVMFHVKNASHNRSCCTGQHQPCATPLTVSYDAFGRNANGNVPLDTGACSNDIAIKG